jgi:hypothetical protein
MSGDIKRMKSCLNARIGAVSCAVQLSECGKEASVSIVQTLKTPRPGTILDLAGSIPEHLQGDYKLSVVICQMVDSRESLPGQFVGVWINPIFAQRFTEIRYKRCVQLVEGQVWIDLMIGCQPYCRHSGSSFPVIIEDLDCLPAPIGEAVDTAQMVFD